MPVPPSPRRFGNEACCVAEVLTSTRGLLSGSKKRVEAACFASVAAPWLSVRVRTRDPVIEGLVDAGRAAGLGPTQEASRRACDVDYRCFSHPVRATDNAQTTIPIKMATTTTRAIQASLLTMSTEAPAWLVKH
jgi:hypothetical protein